MIEHLTETQKTELRDAIKDISDIKEKIGLYRSAVSESIAEIAENFSLEKKYVRKMANVYHKGTYINEVYEMEDFSALYENVFHNIEQQ